MKRLTSLTLIGVFAALNAACQNARQEPNIEQEVAKPEANPATTSATNAPTTGAVNAPTPDKQDKRTEKRDIPAGVKVDDIGVIRAAPGLQNSISRIMSVADANADGKVTRDEANGALNFVIGGLFFRADGNGDGKITVQEREAARVDFAKSHPEIDGLLTSFLDSTAAQTLKNSIDAELDQTIDLQQTRAAIRKTVDGVFHSVDKNADGTITAEEADRGFNVAAAALGRAAFTKADKDNDGKMTLAEFQTALDAPLKRAFGAADANGDGRLTDDEAASMMWWLSERVDAVAERSFEAISNAAETSPIRK